MAMLKNQRVIHVCHSILLVSKTNGGERWDPIQKRNDVAVENDESPLNFDPHPSTNLKHTFIFLFFPV